MPCEQLPKTINPNAPQAYKGNGEHTWETVAGHTWVDWNDATQRLRVPGGWLYRNVIIVNSTKFRSKQLTVQSMTFVPTPVHLI